MFPVRRVRGTETGDGNRRLEKIGNNRGTHLYVESYTSGTRTESFRYGEPGTVIWYGSTYRGWEKNSKENWESLRFHNGELKMGKGNKESKGREKDTAARDLES